MDYRLRHKHEQSSGACKKGGAILLPISVLSDEQIKKFTEILQNNKVEVYGIIDGDEIKILKYGTETTVTYEIDMDNINKNIFHTHPLHMMSKHGNYFHSQSDMYYSIIKFFSNNQKPLNHLVITKYGIVNLYIRTDQIIQDDDIVGDVIKEINNFSFNEYKTIVRNILQENNYFAMDILRDDSYIDKELAIIKSQYTSLEKTDLLKEMFSTKLKELTIARVQYKLLQYKVDLLNESLNTKLTSYEYIKHVKIYLSVIYNKNMD